MSQRVNPLDSRTAELHEYAASDLSVEEKLAGGASVDDLIDAGVLHVDDEEGCCFTPETTPEELAALRANFTPGPPMPHEAFLASVAAYFRIWH
ncbi:MAG: hypothetical protein AAFR58_16240 [Cyanobacteria bacterium J06627_28]